MYDYLFVFTEESDNEGEDFLVECESLEKANVILEMSGLKPNEYRFIKRYSCEEGEMLGLDTY